ncbi:hypothetical protein [Alkalilimnicola ehrlichii]|uniref:hypothetical protein n=1 Tax=Alkalilimnicola ehrlichii TaxID=351052 RepID=UPI000E2E7D9D|nr:hypothetical protein [Alkalilimnicola ehrlichii]
MSKATIAASGLVAVTLAASPALWADSAVPHHFQAGNTAVAAEVNENFEALIGHIQALEQRIDELESELKQVQNSDAMALNDVMAIIPDPHAAQGQTVRFSGVNLQLVNGQGSTATANGLGNLILGYNEARQGEPTCSLGRRFNSAEADAESLCIGAGGTWAVSFKQGSHNLVGGQGNAYSGYGGLVLGQNNAATGAFSAVAGGRNNIVAAEHSVIVGGAIIRSRGRRGARPILPAAGR